MIPDDEAQAIADCWVESFSANPYVLGERKMDAWFELDGLIQSHPQSALVVFEKVAEMDLINWTFEGIAVGPLRTFLMLHGDLFERELGAIMRRSKAFHEMLAMAVEGI